MVKHVWTSTCLLLCIIPSLADAAVQLPMSRSRALLHDRDTPNIKDDFLLTVDLAIGNPPQQFNMSLNFTKKWAAVFDSSIHRPMCRGDTGVRRFFNTGRSTTFRYALDVIFDDLMEYFVTCPDQDPEFFSQGGVDDVKAGGITAKKAKFVIAQIRDGAYVDPTWPADGVLGMAHSDPSSSDDRTPSTVHALATAAGGGQVTIFINRDARDDAAGTLTLGGKDDVNCDSRWHLFKVPQDHDYADVWHLHALSVSIGKGLTFGGITIVLDHFDRISLPGQIFGDVMGTLNATKDSKGTFSVACANAQRLPDIVLSLMSSEQEPYEYRIPAADYTTADADKSGRCALLLTPDDYLSWTIGIPALKSHCWMLDFDNNSIGVARVA